MSSPFAIIAAAWRFYKKQPVLNTVTFWLLFAPTAALDTVTGLTETVTAQSPMQELQSFNPVELAVAIPLVLVFVYLLIWGHACVLMIGRRMVSSPAGRTRTSFSAVRSQAQSFIFPLFATEIIRGCLTLLWALLLIVPGIIYAVRTVFYDILIIADEAPYGRPALRASTELVRGRTWGVFWRLFVMLICVFAPVSLLGSLIAAILTNAETDLSLLAILIGDALDTYAGMFFLLCVIALFADMRKGSGKIQVADA